jgi:hypothetical protein
MNRKKTESGEKRTQEKNYLDRMFRSNLFGVLDRAAANYDKHGFQRTAKIVRIFKEHAKILIGGL